MCFIISFSFQVGCLNSFNICLFFPPLTVRRCNLRRPGLWPTSLQEPLSKRRPWCSRVSVLEVYTIALFSRKQAWQYTPSHLPMNQSLMSRKMARRVDQRSAEWFICSFTVLPSWAWTKWLCCPSPTDTSWLANGYQSANSDLHTFK